MLNMDLLIYCGQLAIIIIILAEKIKCFSGWFIKQMILLCIKSTKYDVLVKVNGEKSD